MNSRSKAKSVIQKSSNKTTWKTVGVINKRKQKGRWTIFGFFSLGLIAAFNAPKI